MSLPVFTNQLPPMHGDNVITLESYSQVGHPSEGQNSMEQQGEERGYVTGPPEYVGLPLTQFSNTWDFVA